MKTITVTTDLPEGTTVRAKFTVVGDTRTVRRRSSTPGATTTVTETFDNLVGIERIPLASLSTREVYWYNIANNIPNPPPVPEEIANWRARAVLELAGLLDDVTAALYAMEGDAGVIARSAWNAGAPLARKGPTVTALSALLELTQAQVDSMFIQAGNLTV